MKGIFGVVQVVQHPLAHTQHHGAMLPHQGLKGFFLMTDSETLQQLAVQLLTSTGRADAGDPADVAHQTARLSSRHTLGSPGKALSAL